MPSGGARSRVERMHARVPATVGPMGQDRAPRCSGARGGVATHPHRRARGGLWARWPPQRLWARLLPLALHAPPGRQPPGLPPCSSFHPRPRRAAAASWLQRTPRATAAPAARDGSKRGRVDDRPAKGPASSLPRAPAARRGGVAHAHGANSPQGERTHARLRVCHCVPEAPACGAVPSHVAP